MQAQVNRRTPLKTTMTKASRIEVLTGVSVGRWSVEEKIRLVEEANRPGMSVSYVGTNTWQRTKPDIHLEWL